MKIAIIQDGLMCKAGGEQVALAFHRAFPLAPIFTLAYDKNNTFSEFESAVVITSFLQKISNKDKIVKKLFFPFGVIAAKMIDVTAFDVVLMTTTHCAKYVKVSPHATVFCYSHNPFRLAWYPNEYKQYLYSKGVKRWVFDKILDLLKSIDKDSIKKVDYMLTNSTIVKERLKGVYDNYKGEIDIIPPPVDVSNFYVSTINQGYFLVVSRLEYYKKIELIVEVFNDLNLPLKIVGQGTLEYSLHKKANRNIVFLKNLSKEELGDIYSNARCLLFPQLEDYGITPLEANASGIPVIAYGKGGVLDTQIYNPDNLGESTALFFENQTVEDIKNCINDFIKIENQFKKEFIRKNAEKFSSEKFIEKIQHYINEKAP